MLLYDPNVPEELESKITIIRRDEWDELVELCVILRATYGAVLSKIS